MPRISLNAQSAATRPILRIAPNPYLNELKSLFTDIENSIPWSATFPTFQSCLHVTAQAPGDLLLGCGSSSGLAASETDFDQLAAPYRGSVIERLLADLPMPIVRLRWMKLTGHSCYSLHTDTSMRLQIPIVTNEANYFIFPDHGLFHLSEGGIYSVNTKMEHSFMNGSDQTRVHLVGVIA